ncbi:MAG: HAMP domain-containing protein [Zetaproteobacteria bacterium]|nr:MAG: HAMP domain-containing protein [Zetaproteobacteria bacterium]
MKRWPDPLAWGAALAGLAVLGLAAKLGLERHPTPAPWLHGLDGVLAAVMGGVLVRAGFVLWRRGVRAGERLRMKLWLATVAFMFVPVLLVQTAANAIVDKGLSVWFDVRVEALLDEAMALARAVYTQAEQHLRADLETLSGENTLALAAAGFVPTESAAEALRRFVHARGLGRAEVFDLAGRMLIGIGPRGELEVTTEPWGEAAAVALRLGTPATELKRTPEEDVAVGYAPLALAGRIVGLVRIERAIPAAYVHSARAVEQNYRRYQTLAHQRAALQALFADLLLAVTLLVALAAMAASAAFARRLSRPVAELSEALDAVAGGNLEVRIPHPPADELGALAQAFNAMAARLRESMAAMARIQRELADALASSRQRQQVLETLLASLHAGVLLVDDAGTIRLINAAWRRLLGVDEGWRPGVRLEGRLGSRLASLGAFVQRAQQAQGPLHDEIEIEVGGERRRLAVAASRITTGAGEGFAGVLLVVEDITEIVRSEQLRAWAEVARRLAHEIKNPLTPIRLAAERLIRRIRPKLSEDLEVFDASTRAIIDQVDRLLRLVNEFSLFARLPKPRMRRVDAVEVTRELAALYAATNRVRFLLPEGPMPATLDPDQIKQLLINLIENALAAVGDKGEVRVGLEARPEAWVWFVEDDGPGVSPEIQDKIFAPYFSTREQGTGLGLAIARRIAEEHGGKLVLAHAAQPTRFELHLPKEASA